MRAYKYEHSARFCEFISNEPGLESLARYIKYDFLVCKAVIWRWLVLEIFQHEEILCGILRDETQVLKDIGDRIEASQLPAGATHRFHMTQYLGFYSTKAYGK